ncbi:MAG: rod shape-determining protein MreC [Candidatus Kinetoplastibacterium crithidii]|nr:rod shape-determining protein MreC [Candidatus Kinetoplastibacterium crithidii]
MDTQRGIRPLFRRGISLEIKLFIALLVALILLTCDARFPNTVEPVRKLVSVVIYPFQRIVLIPRDTFRCINNWFNAANMIRRENELLQKQYIEMAQITTRLSQLTAENYQLRKLLGITDTIKESSIVVEILYESNNSFNQHLIFNKGSKVGVSPGMSVISEGGVVGQIIRVTPVTAEAALVSDHNVSVPVQITRNGLRLITFGLGMPGLLEVRYLTDNFDIKIDDLLVTSGIGGIFPVGLPVAKVIKVEKDHISGYSRAIAESVAHPEYYRHFIVLKIEIN